MKKSSLNILPILLLIFVALSGLETGCRSTKTEDKPAEENIDTLRVVTLYGPVSYFNYRGEIMGIDYENVKRFAEDEGMVLEIQTKENIPELISALQNGEAHLAAYPIPEITEYNSLVVHCGLPEVSRQVIVQKAGPEKLTDVTQLPGKDVYVEKNSKYQYRLENLNEELGGGINIIPIESDTITSEDLLPMVSKGEIQYAVIDSDIASLYGKSFPDLDTSLRISADQTASWAVAPGLDSLASRINSWENRREVSDFVKDIYKRYYDATFTDNFDANLSYFKNKNLKKGSRITQYDELFKKYAPLTGFDWRLLAAIAFCESRYNADVVSRFGATGLMQVMPASARAMGVDPSQLLSPDPNILAAAKIIAKLDKTLEDKVENPEERFKFIVAGYNSGLGHIYDAMALAEKTGLDPQKWNGNVSVAALMKSRPEYYNDPVVKHGYFRGRETVDFVDHVTAIYNYLLSI